MKKGESEIKYKIKKQLKAGFINEEYQLSSDGKIFSRFRDRNFVVPVHQLANKKDTSYR